jgi:uncharacterized protein (TIGR02217 family)
MAFLETPRFPECVSFGATSKPRYKTDTIPLASGYKSRNIEWAQSLHGFDFSHNAFLEADHQTLLHFFHALQGAGNQFRVKDFSDYVCTNAEGLLVPLHGSSANLPVGTVGVGYGAKYYLLAKKYTSGALSVMRWLQKPVVGTVVVKRGGVTVTEGTGAGQIDINETTGKVAFVADQTRLATASAVGTTHEFTFATAFSPNFTVGQRIYIEGVGGTAGAVLDYKSHEITFVSSATIRVATNTTGLAVALHGNGYFMPQASESLTVACEFDVPCVFTSDEASFAIIEKQNGGGFIYQWSGIAIEEDRIPL